MNAGMLWFDNDPKTALTAKIERAAYYYRHKYGRDPNLCLIHPSMLPKDDMMDNPANEAGVGEQPATGKPALPAPELQAQVSAAEGVRVRPYRPVLPGHIWIGIEDLR